MKIPTTKNKCDLNDKHTPMSIVLLFISLFTCPLFGQVQQKRMLAEADYKLWHDVQMDKMAADGEWLSYRLIYEDCDTLFVKNTSTKKMLGFAGGTNSSFSKGYFICLLPDKKLQVLRLKDFRLTTYENVNTYQMAGAYLLYHRKEPAGGTLAIVKVDSSVAKVIPDVTEYIVSPDKKQIAVSTHTNGHYEVAVLQLGTSTKSVVVAENKTALYKKLTWSNDGSALAFFSDQHSGSSVYYYVLKNKNLSVLDCSTGDCFSAEKVIQSEQKIAFSQDNSCVFFTVQQDKEHLQTDESLVQVWNAADKQIYPGAQVIAGWKNIAVQVMWTPRSGKVVEINNAELPFGGAVGNKEVALTYNPERYEPQGEIYAQTDYYLTHLRTGKNDLLLENHSSNDSYFVVSPLGKYITYFKQGAWFVYDIQKEKHIAVTNGIPVSFADTESDRIGARTFYRTPEWTVGDKSLLLYDQYDVWEVFLDGRLPKRLTKGRENSITFRVVPQNSTERSSTMSRVRTSGRLDLSQSILLSATSADYRYSGFYTFSRTSGLRKITYTDRRTRNAVQNEKRTITAWIGESFESAPEIFLSRNGVVQSIFKSNLQQARFFWGKSEIVHYDTADGQPLSGILYYPAGFESGKKYPMVVNIYEQQLSGINHYWIPRINNGTGINFANLTAKGYFVFRPDIVFKSKYAGQSALDCVESAVKKVLCMGHVDANRIGLTGHSFGGYETNYIISQSTLFACAVSGAAVSDLVSANHAVHQSYKIPNFFIIENAQYRIGGSIADKKDYFINNSPIYFAGTINTPLLAWAGLEDTQVDPRQSVELYMALRRLGKKHIMLLYPNEIHELLSSKNTEDLTRKVETWFDHYLKGKPSELWMVAK